MKKIAFILLLILPSLCFATDYAVCPGGTGNGTSWTACMTFPSALVRGNTYYLASGTYTLSPATFTISMSGATPTEAKILKAIDADHGPSSGWNDTTYGQGVATIVGSLKASNDCSYLTIDGKRGGGPNSWKSGHGIKFASVFQDYAIGVDTTNGTLGHLTLRHIDFENGDENEASIIKTCSNAGVSTNVTVEYCYFHSATSENARVDFHCIGDDSLIQYSFFGQNGRGCWPAADGCSGGNAHKELASIDGIDNLIFRWNIAEDIGNTGHFGYVNGNCPGGMESNNNEFYGNVFVGIHSDNEVGGAGRVTKFFNVRYDGTCTGSGEYRDNLIQAKVYNNSFIRFKQSNDSSLYVGKITNADIRNNIYYSIYNPSSDLIYLTKSHNTYINSGLCGSPPCSTDNTLKAQDSAGGESYTGSPFTDWQNENFALTSSFVAAQSAGSTLASPYNVDMYGTTRGGDGKWDRGAIEYGPGGSITGVNAPGGVTIK